MKKDIKGFYIKNPDDLYAILRGTRFPYYSTEHFGVALLNQAGQLIDMKCLFIGGITKCTVDQRVIFRYALQKNAVAIILWHNHPSGSKEPSKEDIFLTEQVKKGGQILNVQLLDHLILSRYGYTSLKSDGYLEDSAELKAAERG